MTLTTTMFTSFINQAKKNKKIIIESSNLFIDLIFFLKIVYYYKYRTFSSLENEINIFDAYKKYEIGHTNLLKEFSHVDRKDMIDG